MSLISCFSRKRKIEDLKKCPQSYPVMELEIGMTLPGRLRRGVCVWNTSDVFYKTLESVSVCLEFYWKEKLTLSNDEDGRMINHLI